VRSGSWARAAFSSRLSRSAWPVVIRFARRSIVRIRASRSPRSAASAAASAATYIVTVSGRFRTTPCAGRIRFTASAKGSKKVSSIASIKSNCTFRKSFTYRTSSRTARRAKLLIRQTFLGNTKVLKGRAKTLAVRLK